MKGGNVLRQKMINMLYLALIGMVVLNLPVDFIEAFTDLNKTLERSNYRLDQKNRKALEVVGKISRLDSSRYANLYNSIITVKAISDSAVLYLEDLKLDLIARAGGYGKYRHLVKAIDATIPTRRMIRDGLAYETKEILVETKSELMNFLSANERKGLDSVLVTADTIPKATGQFIEWEKYYFDNVPLSATIATITKFQNDVRLAESIVIGKYYEVAEGGVHYSLSTTITDGLTPDTIIIKRVEEKLDVFNVGESATVRVSVPGMSEQGTNSAILYTYDENNNIIDSFLLKDGVGEISLNTDKIGEFKMKGAVKFRYNDEQSEGQGGDFEEQPEQVLESLAEEHTFELDYSVLNPKPYISNADFSLLYIGVNNAVNIHHPEFSEENYNVKISQGKIHYDGKQFYAKVYRPGFVNVSLEIPDQYGGFKKVAEQKFKVIELPEPNVKLYNSSGGNMAANIFKKQKGLSTEIQGLNINAKFRVMEFTVVYINKSGMGIFKENVKGSYFTDRSLELINLAEPGDIFIFENIRVKGPDGKNRKADALVFNVI